MTSDDADNIQHQDGNQDEYYNYDYGTYVIFLHLKMASLQGW